MQDNPTTHDMTNTLTLCITQQTLLPAFPSSMLAQLFIEFMRSCNIIYLVPASPTPRRYFLLYQRNTIEAFFKLSRFPSIYTVPCYTHEAREQLPFRMSSSHSALSRPSEENILSTTLHQYFLCLPLRGLTFHSCTKSSLEYRCSGIVATLYHHFNFALSLRPCSDPTPRHL